MLLQLTVATVMVLITVIVHGAGIAGLGRLLRLESYQEHVSHLPPMSTRSLIFTLALVLCLFTLHGVEIWLYAALYVLVDAVPHLETGVYFSTITYGGIGFTDNYLDPDWRLVAAIEGVNGVLLLGWSTAFFVAVISRLGR